MLKDSLAGNRPAAPDSDRIAVLKEHFPACFRADGSFDPVRFSEYLRGGTDLADDGYGLRFPGKSYAERLASLDTETLIRPDTAHNEKPENADSGNIYISGNNLDALRHLLGSYRKKIKCIYIDPPYNRGKNDFVYRDRFDLTLDELRQKPGLTPEQAERLADSARQRASSHSAWLMFMYPRLLLARELLAENGLIFISIDDNEQANLKLLCDEVFGEENFVAQIIVQSNKRGQTYKRIAKTHEYLLVYAAGADAAVNELVKETGAFPAEDDLGGFEERELRNRNPKFGKFNRPNLFYPIYAAPAKTDRLGYMPVSLTRDENYSVEILPLNSGGAESCWRWSARKLAGLARADTISCDVAARRKNNGTYGVYEKYRKRTCKAKSIWYRDQIGEAVPGEADDIWDETDVIFERGSSELTKLGMSDAFDFPKPVALLKKILMIGMDRGSTCLDFFSGSATTAQAVAELNSEGYGIHGIFVQLPEDLDEKQKTASKADRAKLQKTIDFLDRCGYPHTLDHVGLERIRRAAAKIRAQKPQTRCDLGCKHYILETPPANTLCKTAGCGPGRGELIPAGDMLAALGGTETVLTTWLVRDGYGFSPGVKPVELHDHTAWRCGRHLYLIEPGWGEQDIAELFRKCETDGGSFPETVVFSSYSFDEGTVRKMLDRLRGGKRLKIDFEFRY